MKWSRAVHHVESLAGVCASMATRPATIFPLRVTQLWVFGDLLGSPTEVESVAVALAVDLPPADVPWLSEPAGAQHWANATRLAQSPVAPFWRSAHAPVWNHRVIRPALVWDDVDGVREQTLAALLDGRGATVALPEPTAGELAGRLAAETRVSLAALRDRTARYAERRWSPGKLEPVADALWRVSDGYLDLLDATTPA